MFEVTLKDLRTAGACFDGYNKLVRHLQGKKFTAADSVRDSYIRFSYDDPIPLLTILDSNGLDDALWACRCLNNHDRDFRLYAVWFARRVEHLNPDPRVKNCNDIAERFANGEATEAELVAARAAARAARAAARAAWVAARAAWEVAGEVARAAWEAAGEAAGEAAMAAAWTAAGAVAGAAAWTVARAAQSEMFIRMCNGTAPWQIGEKS